MARLAPEERISSIHLSAPDRGQLRDSWIPWRTFLDPILPVYDGPFLIEVFNALPAFVNSFRLTRRKFWIPGEDDAGAGRSRRVHGRRRGDQHGPRRTVAVHPRQPELTHAARQEVQP